MKNKILLLCICGMTAFAFRAAKPPHCRIEGKYDVKAPKSLMTLKIKKNGRCCYVMHLIRRTKVCSGNWTMSGDTLLLHFPEKNKEERYLWSKPDKLLGLDDSTRLVRKKRR